MFIELIDLLRCTRPHEDSWLVATFYDMRERKVMEGVLSCPICSARYVVKEGVAYFDVEPDASATSASASDDAVRVAAYLNLLEPGVVVLHGEWGASADGIAAMGNTVIALNSHTQHRSASHVRSDGVLPVARESMDGIAVVSADDRVLESAAVALKNGARLVAPAAAKMPEGLSELARDESYWVAAKRGRAVSAPVQIARR